MRSIFNTYAVFSQVGAIEATLVEYFNTSKLTSPEVTLPLWQV